jgi:hypothetical protein
MPPIKKLKNLYGSRWRPPIECQFFSTRLYIMRKVYRRCGNIGRIHESVAEDLDRERGTDSSNKIYKLIKSKKNIKLGIPLS